ncbi:MAG: DUF4097 family beta strand repeat protein [Elusimicrobia bacterium]|nr:DUF4097 family beta strand repeat protein [Elusimicrobiota bacterium]
MTSWLATMLVLATGLAWAAPEPGSKPVISEPKDFSLKAIKLIKVSADSGGILVRGGKQGSARVLTVGSLNNCTITTEVRGPELVVEAKHPFMKTCLAGFAVEADVDVPVRLYAGSGDIEVSARRGMVEADTGSGSILVKDAVGELVLRSGSGDIKAHAAASKARAQSGSGSIELRKLFGSADVMTGSGNIALEWGRAPRSGEAEVKSGSGNIELVFPQGTKLASSMRTGTGSTSNELGDTPGADWRVSATSGTGDVTIRGPAPKKR